MLCEKQVFLIHLIRQRLWLFSLVVLLTVVSALVSVGVLAFIRQKFFPADDLVVDVSTLLIFFALVLGMLVLAAGTQMLLHYMGHSVVLNLRQTLVRRVLKTSVEQLQRIGNGRILAMLNADVRSITMGVVELPELLHSVFLSVTVMAYLAYLSLPMFAMTLVCVIVIAAIGALLVGRLGSYVSKVRGDEDRLHQDYQSMISGKRELALNRARAKAFFDDELTAHACSYRNNITRADCLVDISNNMANAMMLSLIGLSFYMVSGLGLASTDIAAVFALAILFLRTPMMVVVAAFPIMITANVSFKKLQSLNLAEDAAFASNHVSKFSGFKCLSLNGAVYEYKTDDGGFSVGPIDFSVAQGELIFIIGGNGSGKSTFAHLLCGLYRCQKGQIAIDGAVVSDDELDDYRHLFSSVFTDFHVFRQLIDGNGELADKKTVDIWLERLQIQHKVTAESGLLDGVDLSQGQKKRLALLLAMLEKRDVLLLDEWAADQDPQFRHYFYSQLLPILREQGKTIIAITHDDHYFDCADRILKMHEGKLLALNKSEREALNAIAHLNAETQPKNP